MFAAPLTDHLAELGHDVVLLDVMKFAGSSNPEGLLSALVDEVAHLEKQPDLIAGYAFGGLAAVHLARHFPKAAILGLSAPIFVDAGLRHKLTSLSDLLDAGQSQEAISLLHSYVNLSGAASELEDVKAQEMSQMFKLLLTLATLDAGPLEGRKQLYLHGAQSDLVTANHLPANLQHYGRAIARSGMRVLNDNPAVAVAYITDWIH